MEDDEEVQSQASEGTGSPASPRSNGRITVTVAAAPPPQNTNTLTLALPIQQQSKTSGGGGGREDCWSEGATAVLIEAWGERYLELSRGNLKQQHWKDVADIVASREDYSKPPKTDIQCKNRIDTVKKKYKLEKAKIAAGQGPSRWTFFERLDELIGPTAKGNNTSGSGGFAGPSASNQKVPMGIPMGARSAPQLRRPPIDSDSSESEPEPSPDSTDSSPPPTYEKKRPRIQQRELMMNSSVVRHTMPRGRDGGATPAAAAASGSERDRNWANSVRELTRAILKFGEAYEQAENAKLQQMVEMEKQRMKFAKELELQKMQVFMKTQLELSQLKNRRVGSSNHHNNNTTTTATNNNNNNNTNSFSSN
nr:trihelix transcription factor ASIL2 [Ipomoea batatas]